MQSGDKVILLDLGGVVVEATGRKALAGLLPHLDDDQILARWDRSRAVGDFERGKISSEAFARAFAAEWGLGMPEQEFLEQFASWVGGFVDGATELIEDVRARFHVSCLSNTNAIHWSRLPGVSSLFDSVFPSHLTGFMKPERDAYAHVLAELRVRAQDVYFFDDLTANVAAAREFGINAFQVRGIEDLIEALTLEGMYRTQAPNPRLDAEARDRGRAR